MDAEHHALFQFCDRLRLALKAKEGAARVGALLDELAAHAVEHFSHEEREMRSARYSLYAWHKRQHVTAGNYLVLLKQASERGDQDEALESLAFLSAWLNDHIRLADRMLAASLRNHRRARQALAS